MSHDDEVDRDAATRPLRADDIVQSLRGALEHAQHEIARWKAKAEELAAENAAMGTKLRAAEDLHTRAQHDLDQLKQQVAEKLSDLHRLVGDPPPAPAPAVISPTIDGAFDAKATMLQPSPGAPLPSPSRLTADAPTELRPELARSSPDFEDDGTVEVNAQVARTTLDSEALQSPAPMPSMTSDTDPEAQTRQKR
jgi:hypothetical protein